MEEDTLHEEGTVDTDTVDNTSDSENVNTSDSENVETEIDGASDTSKEVKENTDVHASVGTAGTADTVDYTDYLDMHISLSVIIIFVLGIIAGLISARILWDRVKHV